MSYRARVTTDTRKRMKLRCLRHGKKPWRGDIICEKCQRVYLRADENVFPTAPESGTCICGVRLFPVHDEDGKTTSAYFSGRAVCEHCADARTS